ncbi:DUF2637 domain-containing protein [Nocardia paucivorans]|uniref:DUF2637 domain-containing protein n=1 Tax=Nocardia paucivorans TaxID=114259 RepID=UPI0002FA902F|nr:DUF2637 domain-containing protein [Nocardia paucivorans]
MADIDVDRTTPVPGATPAASAGAPRAHTFFWAVLITAAAVSITGNATQAVLHDTQLPAVAAVVAVIPPVALLAAVHGVSVLSHAHAHARGTYLLATAMTVMIAAGAFWLSFTALRSLAITAGIPRGEAWLWPVIIEGSMGQATVALLSLARSRTLDDGETDTPFPVRTGNGSTAVDDRDGADGYVESADEHIDVRTPPTPVVRTPDSPLGTVRTAPAFVVRAPDPSPGTVRTVPEVDGRTPEYLSALARQLCARDRAGRRDPDLVTQILTLHHIEGLNPSQIARRVVPSRTTVSRILSDARDLHAEKPITLPDGVGHNESPELSRSRSEADPCPVRPQSLSTTHPTAVLD